MQHLSMLVYGMNLIIKVIWMNLVSSLFGQILKFLSNVLLFSTRATRLYVCVQCYNDVHWCMR